MRRNMFRKTAIVDCKGRTPQPLSAAKAGLLSHCQQQRPDPSLSDAKAGSLSHCQQQRPDPSATVSSKGRIPQPLSSETVCCRGQTPQPLSVAEAGVLSHYWLQRPDWPDSQPLSAAKAGPPKPLISVNCLLQRTGPLAEDELLSHCRPRKTDPSATVSLRGRSPPPPGKRSAP